MIKCPLNKSSNISEWKLKKWWENPKELDCPEGGGKQFTLSLILVKLSFKGKFWGV